MNVLGVSAYYHDSAACILKNGELIAAYEEEKISRIKHDKSFPIQSIRMCLSMAKLQLQDLDLVAFYEDPKKKQERKKWMMKQRGLSEYGDWEVLNETHSYRFEYDLRRVLGYEGDTIYIDHHQSHAASSYYYSGFEHSAILTVDGVGEWATTTFGEGAGLELNLFDAVTFPHSLGLLYSAITAYLGFEVNNGEYKVMGLAPYGEPSYEKQMWELIELESSGKYSLNMDYFGFIKGDAMYSSKLEELFRHESRLADTELTAFHCDIARSIQLTLEKTLLHMACYIHERVGSQNLSMAGGVALNCVANSKILNHSPFSNLFVQPAANDAGGALGAAAMAYYSERKVETGKVPAKRKRMKSAFLGPEYSSNEIGIYLKSTGIRFIDHRQDEDTLLDFVCSEIAEGKVIAWFYGRAEFGPRALGARSILADPRREDMRDRINEYVKKREQFRPFAPAVLADKVKDHFILDHESPFMLETCEVKSPLKLPAITHIDGSARVQTVSQDNGRFSRLLAKYYSKTGCPILLNTSFNIRGEPIVSDPEAALKCFINTSLDVLVLQDYIIDKADVSSLLSMPARLKESQGTARSVSNTIYEML